MAQDSLDDGAADEAASGPQVTVFVDATVYPHGGSTGAEVAYGPRIGPMALEAMLCTGGVQVIGLATVAPPLPLRRREPFRRRFGDS
jgi:hypothetical protein